MGQHYPFPTYRDGVKEASNRIRKAFAAGKRFVIFDAALGSGKSSVAVEFSREFKTPILTPTKLLQQQYADTKEFNLEYVIKGKSNYKCGLPLYNETTCDEAICCSDATAADGAADTNWEEAIVAAERPANALKQRCVQAGICEYYGLIAQIGNRPGAIMNYDLFFHIKKNNGRREGIDMGECLVMDEAHQLIGKIKDIFGYKMSNATAMRLLGQEAKRTTNESVVAWLGRLVQIAATQKNKELDRKKISSLTSFMLGLDRLLKLDITNDKKFFIDDKSIEIDIKPLNMKYLKGLVFAPFNKILMMSATFPPNFCELLGITDDEVEHIHVASTFPKENRKVYVAKDMPVLNYKSELTKDHPVVVGISRLIEKHKNDKGIVHCSNYNFFNQLKKVFEKNHRFIWVERGENKTISLTKHSKSDQPTILVSASMTEGVDLKDDLSRFQIMVKLPFPTLDDYTKKMMKIYSNYYENIVATNITQAYGRAVRTPDDHADFYILDGAIVRLLSNKRIFSKYFMEALVVADADKFI